MNRSLLFTIHKGVGEGFTDQASSLLVTYWPLASEFNYSVDNG